MHLIKRSVLPLLLALLAFQPAFSQTPETPPKTVAVIAPTNIISEADTALRTLQGIDTSLTSENIVSFTQSKLAAFNKRTDPFFLQSAEILEANPSLDRLRSLNEGWTEESISTVEWKRSLAQRSAELAAQLAQTSQTIEVWENTKKTIPASPPELRVQAKAVLTLAYSVRSKIQERQKEMLGLESKLAEQDIRIRDMLGSIQEATTKARTNLFVQDTPPAWATEFRNGLGHSLEDSADSWANQSTVLRGYLVNNLEKIFLQIILATTFIALLFITRRKLREWAGNDSELKTAFQIFETPIAAAFLLALVISGWLYPYAPNLWRGFLGAFTLIPTIIILHHLIERRLFPILNALVFFYFLDQVRLLSSAQPGLLRLVFLSECLSAVLFLTWLLLSFRKTGTAETSHLTRAVQFGGRIALILSFFAFLSDLAGYDRLGVLLLNGVLRSSYMAVILYAGVHLIQALVLASFKTPFMSRLGVVRQYRPVLRFHTFRILNWGTFFLWLLITLEFFSIREPLFKTLGAILTTPIRLGALGGSAELPAGALDGPSLTLANLIAFGVTIWAAFLISRLVRFVLDQDVYPHFKLSQGVPYAISNVVHYSILLFAFFVATAALGIDMTKFTILVSAFGVGIGFGLQNIINNFVSGLILLFERPVKVGDSIQVGDAIGTVRRIGIRASVLRTHNGSEIIVPNATLISTNVTNWTLSKQRRIIVLPINVAQGPEPDHVIDILKREATEHPSVLEEPEPQVMIISLAANLSFELRVWTAEVENWPRIRSDLFLTINQALAKEGIKPA